MKRYILLLLTTILCNSCGEEEPALKLYSEIANPAAANALSELEKTQGWQLLFDGRGGAGWHGYNQQGVPDCWALEDGCLTMNTTGGGESQDLITDKVYRDFAFTTEYRLTKGANSGVIFQVKEDSAYVFPYETGPEFQLIDHESWTEELKVWQIHGANYAMYPPATKPYKPAGEWNRLLLVVAGNEVTQVINGVVTVKYTKYSDEWNKLRDSGKWTAFPDWGKFDEGHVSLQNHGTKVWFRDIKIKELTGSGSVTSR